MKSAYACIIPGSAANGGLPYFAEPEDMDQWPSAAVTEQAHRTIAEIVLRGFMGVHVERYRINAAGQEKYLFRYHNDPNTPEGLLAEHILKMASRGKSIPTAMAMSFLVRTYREQGIPLPTKQKPGV